jgi:two-component system sensor histidine kinase YesM
MKIHSLLAWPTKLGLKTQLIFVYIILITIPLFIFGIRYFTVSKNIVSEIARKNVYEMVIKNNQIMDTKLSQATDNIVSFLVDRDLYGAFSSIKPTDDYQISLLDKQVSIVMDKYFSHLQDVYSVQLVTSYASFRPYLNPNAGSGKNFIPAGVIQHTSIYGDAVKNEGKIIWIPTYNFSQMFDVAYMDKANIEFRYMFSAAVQVNGSYFDGSSYFTFAPDIEKPVLLVNYKEDFLQNVFRRSLPVDGSYYFIVTSNGQYVSHQDTSKIGTNDHYPWMADLLAKGSGTANVTIDGKSMIVCFDTSKVTGWTSFVVISPDQLLGKILDTLKTYLIYSFLLLIIVALITSYFVTDRITKPIRTLLKAIRKTGEGQFDITVSEKGSKELVVLSQKFKEMNSKIHKLIEEIYESQIREKEAEITALNLQLDPHFMYNTLNLINLISVENGQDEISEMIVSLSNMLKYTVKSKKDPVPFQADWEYLQGYIMIMTKRFEGRFQTMFDMDPDLFTYGVPKFFLQPFVENAFVHAFESTKSGGLLKISGWFDEGIRYFCVEDNGTGIDQETLDKLLKEESGSVGMFNVHQRIRIAYGEQYGVHIESEKGKGTRVTIRLPRD